MSREVAIVGAGAAGAAAAFALRDAAVTVFEERGEVGGRAATRQRHGCVYDYGANYLRGDDERVVALVEETLHEGLVDVEQPVWTFDADGTISEGEDRDDHKWSWEGGLAEVGERLLARSGATVELETPVERLVRTGDRWRLHGRDGADLGTFDAVLLTPPAPQTAAILEASEWEHDCRQELARAARAVPYRTIYSVVLNYGFELDPPWYALVNVDDGHEIGWLSREDNNDIVAVSPQRGMAG